MYVYIYIYKFTEASHHNTLNIYICLSCMYICASIMCVCIHLLTCICTFLTLNHFIMLSLADIILFLCVILLNSNVFFLTFGILKYKLSNVTVVFALFWILNIQIVVICTAHIYDIYVIL